MSLFSRLDSPRSKNPHRHTLESPPLPPPLAAISRLLFRHDDGERLPFRLLHRLRQALGYLDEKRTHVVGILGRRFHVENAVLLGVRFRLVEIDPATGFKVGLVPGLDG